MATFWAYESYQLWLKIYDIRVVTDEYVYADGQVPESYAGPELTLEFAQVLVYVNSAGQFREFRTMDYLDLRDADDKTGLGYTFDYNGVTYEEAPVGPSAVISDWYVKEYTDTLDEPVRAKAAILYGKYLEEVAEDAAEEP